MLPKLIRDGLRPDAIVIDPPRKGCEPQVLEAIAVSGVHRVVYVSCDPGTLARDLRVLTQGGYNVHKIQPVDMFPMTTHCEVVVSMSRVGSKL